jgi:hypothetical protein
MSKFVFVLILGLVLRLVLSTLIYSGDVNNHMGWAESIIKDGSLGAYDRQYIGILQPTYPPLALYSFVTSYSAYKNVYAISQFLNRSIPAFPSKFIWFLEDQDTLAAFHKILSEVSDIGITVLIFVLARLLLKSSSQAAFTAATVYVFNPAVWYNSALWGQLESPPIFFILLSLYLILKEKPLLGHASFAAALLFKQSSLIFFPAFLMFSLFKTGFKKTLTGLASQFMFFYISYLPFFNFQLSSLNYPLSLYLNRLEVGSGSNYISDHAFNLWALFTHLEKIPDTLMIFGNYSANLIGKSAFLLLLLLLLLRFIQSRKISGLVNLMGLINLAAFLVLTRMHERYLAPALPFMAISTAASPQLWPVYLCLSLGHLINMYHNWWYPTLIWLRPVMTSWNTVVLVVIIFVVTGFSWTALYLDETRRQ